jgi:light-regulated signal transduction histidine kinase (bacteriophytochrome)
MVEIEAVFVICSPPSDKASENKTFIAQILEMSDLAIRIPDLVMNNIELSEYFADNAAGISQQLLLNRITNRIRDSLELPEILSATVAEVRAYLGTDRVKIYQFYPDGHGVVIAEAINEQNLPSLQGLHFPADDIPTYVRQHYVSVRQRTVVDLSRAVIGRSNLCSSETDTALTSSALEFQTLDPCHLEYLQ